MKRLLLKLFGWKILGRYPDVDRSVLAVAPHTSYWDGFWGYLALEVLHVPYTILADTRLFHFPMSVLMRIIHAVPVNVHGKDAIHAAVDLLKQNPGMHIVICPEGQLAPTDKWNPGFYHIARLAEVPVVVGVLDYGKKEVSFRQVITDLSDEREVFRQLKEAYDGVGARHPEKFRLPERNLQDRRR